jgi:hypothetical protein
MSVDAYLRTYSLFVMRGLDPRIHLLRKTFLQNGMDCRVKPGNDGGRLRQGFRIKDARVA